MYIPKKIKVGFVNRKDTYSGKLAYITYIDEKGVLRKQTSWEGWRDKTIEPAEIDNEPSEGFCINKDIKRYNGEWWSSTRTMVRVFDERAGGIEFEITTENLIAVLMHTDCLRRGLVGKFVYAWSGKELVLLPTNSVEYQDAVKFTENLGKKVSAKNLEPGGIYLNRKGKEEIYIGRFDYYQFDKNGVRTPTKKHLFKIKEKYGDKYGLEPKNSVNHLTQKVGDVDNYAELLDWAKKYTQTSDIDRIEVEPILPDIKVVEGKDWRGYPRKELGGRLEYLFTDESKMFFTDGAYSINYHNNNVEFSLGNRYGYSGYAFTDGKLSSLNSSKFSGKFMPVKAKVFFKNGEVKEIERAWDFYGI